MLLTGGCLLGTVSYSRLAVELIPFAELPMLIVSVQSARAEDPHRVEQLAVIPLESAIAGLADIERIESYIEPRRAVLYVYYTLDSDQRFAFLRLQERVAATRARIGDDFIAVVMKLDTEQLSNQFMSLQARGVGSLGQIRHVVDQKVVRELETVDGIANVAVYGGRQHSVEVRLDEDALRAANRKFTRRFGSIESALAEQGRHPKNSTLEEMDALWDAAKRAEKASG